MINQLSMWQMVVDLCLVTSIIFCAVRSARGTRVPAALPKTIELETSLRKLISEAEIAGRHLNEQLLRREQNIHTFLADVEKRQKALSLSIVEAEGLTRDLSAISERARSAVKESSIGEVTKGAAPDASLPLAVTQNASDTTDADAQVSFSTKSKSPRASEWLSDKDAEPGTKAKPRSPVQMLQELYGRAEAMLKNGQDLERVSELTKLPVDGIRRLAEMIEIERAEETQQQQLHKQSPPKDPRLGALGVTRRPSSTL